MKALITTVPFGDKNTLPIDLLEKNNIEYLVNPLGKKLTENELSEMVTDFDIIIAGTEPITKSVMDCGKNLKFISRVGIGLDSVDLLAAEKKGILVSYTPDAPAPAVSELTIGLMLSLLRNVHVSNIKMHNGYWNRYFGNRLSESIVGIIGVGRIGKGVIKHLSGFSCKKILINDIVENNEFKHVDNIEWVNKETIYKEADIITLHVPLTGITKNMISKQQLGMMKKNSVVINTSRGGVVNENDLYKSLQSKNIAGAAIDVFENEPYTGNLTEMTNCLLTAHMGSMSKDCRSDMEIKATQEAIRFANGENLKGLVPDTEYAVLREGL